MGCSSCGGGRTGRSIGAATASRRAASLPAGSSEASPYLIGEPDDRVRRVRVIVPIEGLVRSQQAWVTGTGVDAHLESGALHDISATTQRQRLWKVGPYTYTSWQDASRVAAARGTTPVEVA